MRISDWSSDVCSSDLLGAKRTFIGLSQAAGTSGSGRAAEGVGDGVAAVAAEGAAGDLHARASLAALVLRKLQHAPDAVHPVAVVAARDDDVDALPALHEALQDVVEAAKGRPDDLVLLGGRQLRRRRMGIGKAVSRAREGT